MISLSENMKEYCFSLLRKTLDTTSDITQNHIDNFLSIAHIKHVSKGECFIHAGQKPNSFAFVARGLFRYYYIDKKGNEFTKAFFAERSFISSYSALIQNRESYYSIEALEDSIILEIHFEKWKSISEHELCWCRFLLSQIERGYGMKEARERELLLLNAEQRYRSFLQSFPDLEKRVKQHMIASYIGITPVALSRIRKKMFDVNVG